MLLALTATFASAAGVNLNWGACYGGPVTSNRSFAWCQLFTAGNCRSGPSLTGSVVWGAVKAMYR